MGRWRKRDGLVEVGQGRNRDKLLEVEMDDDLPKLPSLVVGLPCMTAGLWVGDNNLGFTSEAMGHRRQSSLHQRGYGS